MRQSLAIAGTTSIAITLPTLSVPPYLAQSVSLPLPPEPPLPDLPEDPDDPDDPPAPAALPAEPLEPLLPALPPLPDLPDDPDAPDEPPEPPVGAVSSSPQATTPKLSIPTVNNKALELIRMSLSFQ
jgi:hypothetical protein